MAAILRHPLGSVGRSSAGKPVISSETWTWLRSPAFRATPLDMKSEADLHFLQGINQLVGHGWPYSPEVAGEPGWRMYAAGAFNAHNPWWFVMPDLSRYLQRVSFALRQGEPANDVALLLPNDDAWASFGVNPDSSTPVTTKLGFKTGGEDVSIDESMGKLLGTKVIPQILDAGFNLDFIDGDAIEALGVKYPVLVLPGVERLPLLTYQKIEQYAHHGGIVVATRRLPSTAPGFLGAQDESQKIREISQRLFRDHGSPGYFVENEDQLGTVLASRLEPDVTLSPKAPDVGFLHRHLNDGELYFIANTSSHGVNTRANFRNHPKFAEWWNPFSGQTSSIKDASEIDLVLQPYESRLIFFSDYSQKPAPLPKEDSHPREIDLSQNWTVSFAG